MTAAARKPRSRQEIQSSRKCTPSTSASWVTTRPPASSAASFSIRRASPRRSSSREQPELAERQRASRDPAGRRPVLRRRRSRSSPFATARDGGLGSAARRLLQRQPAREQRSERRRVGAAGAVGRGDVVALDRDLDVRAARRRGGRPASAPWPPVTITAGAPSSCSRSASSALESRLAGERLAPPAGSA